MVEAAEIKSFTLRAPDHFDPHAETMPRHEIEALQTRRLEELLPRVYAHSALIRRVWDAAGVSPEDINSLADFKARVPFIDKDAIRAHRDRFGDPYGGIRIVDDSAVETVGFTSGTTGDPTPVPNGITNAVEVSHLRELWHSGGRPGDYIVHMMFTFRGGQSRNNFYNAAGLTPIMIPHNPTELPFLIQALKTYRPSVLYMLSTPLLIALEQYFEKTGDDPREIFNSVKGASFGGEPLSPRFAALVKDWGLELFEHSSLGDVSGMTECSAHDGMHGWEDLALVECLDDAGHEVSDGELGELTVTSLADPVAPLIRYRTEDLVRVNRAPCGCGRTHVRIWPVGRKGDRTTVQGKPVLPRDIQKLVERHRETRASLFQIVRPKPEMEVLHVRAGYDPEATADASELAARLTAELGTAFEVSVRVELVSNAELLKLGPPQKIPRVTKQ